MSADDFEPIESDDDETELVPAVFARDAEEAQQYCELLADHGIVGIVASDGVDTEDADIHGGAGEGIGMTRGVAVLVEDAMLDEAGLVIADREDLAEFQFDEDEETDDDDEDELAFAQGIDSELPEDSDPDEAEKPSIEHEIFGIDLSEDDDVDGLDNELDDEFDEY